MLPTLPIDRIALLARARGPAESLRLSTLLDTPGITDLDPLRPIPLYVEDPYSGEGKYLATLVLTAMYQTPDGEIHAELCREIETECTGVLRVLVEAQTGVRVVLV